MPERVINKKIGFEHLTNDRLGEAEERRCRKTSVRAVMIEDNSNLNIRVLKFVEITQVKGPDHRGSDPVMKKRKNKSPENCILKYIGFVLII